MRFRIVDHWPPELAMDGPDADVVFDRDRLAQALSELAAEPPDGQVETHPDQQ